MTDKSEAPAFKTGDEISIMRGKHRGATAIVVDYSTGQYAVKLPDGNLDVINAVNVRVPDEPTITASQLGQAFGDEGHEISNAVFERLEALVPGITNRMTMVKVDA
jgi:ribosomal protein L24